MIVVTFSGPGDFIREGKRRIYMPMTIYAYDRHKGYKSYKNHKGLAIIAIVAIIAIIAIRAMVSYRPSRAASRLNKK